MVARGRIARFEQVIMEAVKKENVDDKAVRSQAKFHAKLAKFQQPAVSNSTVERTEQLYKKSVKDKLDAFEAANKVIPICKPHPSCSSDCCCCCPRHAGCSLQSRIQEDVEEGGAGQLQAQEPSDRAGRTTSQEERHRFALSPTACRSEIRAPHGQAPAGHDCVDALGPWPSQPHAQRTANFCRM
jgi:hypothetical protein